MARPTTTARRYAEAAMEIAARDGTHDAWARDLQLIAEAASDENVRPVLDNPAIPRQQRQALIGDLTRGQASPLAVNLAGLLVERGRVELLPTIALEFRRLLNRQQGIVEAEVVSASPLTDDEMEALRTRVEAMAGAKVDLRTQVDESLIGGLTVKVAGRMLDASIRGRLERLRAELIAGTRTR